MDQQELQALYDKIYKYCCGRLSSRETAEDVTQETFLRWVEHPEYHGKGKDAQYLFTIARNLCIDEYRRRTTDELPEDLPDLAADGTDDPDRLLLRDVLRDLPAEDRDIVLLRYVGGLSVAEIAAVHAVSWFSMNRRIKRILAQMRTHFVGKEGSA